jgi:hypothetical protein
MAPGACHSPLRFVVSSRSFVDEAVVGRSTRRFDRTPKDERGGDQ